MTAKKITSRMKKKKNENGLHDHQKNNKKENGHFGRQKNYMSSEKIKIEKWSKKNKKSENGNFGRKKNYLSPVFKLSHKLKNKLVKIINGNQTSRNSLTIAHWNMGGKHWQRKLIEAEAVTMQYCPDIFIVSEANMLNSLTPLEKNIPGYKLYLPKTSQSQIISRLVIFVKEGINVEVKNELMDDEVSAIWLKCGSRGRRPLLIAGIYREHKFLFQGAETGSDRAQQQRWSKFVDKWKVAAAVANHDVYVVGDTNLDFASWDNPDIAHQRMIEKVKLEIEMSGFQQLVQGMTRSWPGQQDSLLDQVWVNNPEKVISVQKHCEGLL